MLMFCVMNPAHSLPSQRCVSCDLVTSVCFRFPVSSEERLKVHQSAVNYLGLACYTKGSNPVSPHTPSDRGEQVSNSNSYLCLLNPTGALSSMFYLAHEFHDDPRGGILTNTNCGGLYWRFRISNLLDLKKTNIMHVIPVVFVVQVRTVTAGQRWGPCWGREGRTAEPSSRRSGRTNWGTLESSSLTSWRRCSESSVAPGGAEGNCTFQKFHCFCLYVFKRNNKNELLFHFLFNNENLILLFLNTFVLSQFWLCFALWNQKLVKSELTAGGKYCCWDEWCVV